MKKFFTFIILLAAVLYSKPALASSEQITDFRSKILISKENVATIDETINYDFGLNYHHGIKRYVPMSTKIANENKSNYYNFKLIEASADGQSVQIDQSESGNWFVVRLGDPNRTISGSHQYKIKYQMWPVISQDTNGDYLNWNITGNYWEVPILKVSSEILFEPNTQIISSRCYSGVVGSTSQDCQINQQQNALQVSSKNQISQGEGLTINALLSANSFTNYLKPSSIPPINWQKFLGYLIGAIAIALGLIIRLVRYIMFKHKLSEQTVVAQYEPPDSLTPAQMGLLEDRKSNMREISATLIDLAVRGFIKIELLSEKTLFSKAQYKFSLIKSYSQSAADYENKLLDMMFAGGQKEIELKDIDASKAAKTINEIQNSLKDDLEAKGYYLNPPKKKNYGPLWAGFVAIAIVGFIIIKIGSLANGSIISWVFAIVGVSVAIGLSKITKMSAKGYKEWALVEGFKLFLSVTEKDRLKFTDAPEKKPAMFSKFLPFAVALGVEQQWAKQFEGMDISKDASWYVTPSGNYAPIYIASSLTSDFSSAVSSSFVPTSSSGGYSGGGFSGGGGGGGGGGSW